MSAANSTMQKRLPFAFLSVWVLWALYQLAWSIAAAPWRSNPGDWPSQGTAYGTAFGGFFLVSAGASLAWLLLREPNRGLRVCFMAVNVVLLWKFWIGAILVYMHPIMGGHSLPGAAGEWFKHATSSVRGVLATLLPPALILVSMVFWPTYCNTRNTSTTTRYETT